MDKKLVIFAGAFLLLSTSVLCLATDDPDATTPPTDLTKPIFLEKDAKEFNVLLPENRTTGYRWFLISYDSHILTPIDSEYSSAANAKLMGAPGVSNWHFQVKDLALHVPVATSIMFEYRRPWELNAGKQQSVMVLTPGE